MHQCTGSLDSVYVYMYNPYNQDTTGPEESVLISEVSLFQGLKSAQTWYLGRKYVSCLERCPYFRGSLIEGFHRTCSSYQQEIYIHKPFGTCTEVYTCTVHQCTCAHTGFQEARGCTRPYTTFSSRSSGWKVPNIRSQMMRTPAICNS